MKKQDNQKTIDDIEIDSFLKEWLKNTNEELEFGDVKIKQKPNMFSFYREFLNSFLKNRKSHRIYGVDKMIGFEINVSETESLLKVCQDIWSHPTKYHDFKEDENEYYEFIKYLWVDSTECGDVRLVDLVDTKISA